MSWQSVWAFLGGWLTKQFLNEVTYSPSAILMAIRLSLASKGVFAKACMNDSIYYLSMDNGIKCDTLRKLNTLKPIV